MVSIFSPEVLREESKWFTSQTSLFDQTNQVKYNIPNQQYEAFRSNFYGNRSQLLHLNKSIDQGFATEIILRRCFKKCNKFVLEDWIDYDELDCTLKCSSLQKQAYNLLQEQSNI